MEPRRIELDLTPEECMVPAKMRGAVARHLHLPESELGEVHMVRRTLDCRRRNVLYHCVVEVGCGERRVEHGERTPQLKTHTVAQSESRESSLSMPSPSNVSVPPALQALSTAEISTISEKRSELTQNVLSLPLTPSHSLSLPPKLSISALRCCVFRSVFISYLCCVKRR